MDEIKLNDANHFITEKSYSQIIRCQNTTSQPKRLNRNLPQIITTSQTRSPKDEMVCYSDRKNLKITKLTLLRAHPSVVAASTNGFQINNNDNGKKTAKRKRSYSKVKSPVEEYYDKVFAYTKNIFKSKKELVDNKLNIYGDNNEEQYQKHILKLNIKKQKEGKPIREDTQIMKETSNQVKGIKKKICFLKGVVDYAYPKAITHKSKILGRSIVLNTDSNIEEPNRKMAISPEIKIRKSKTNGGCCYTMSSKDEQIRSERERLDLFLLQTIDVKKC